MEQDEEKHEEGVEGDVLKTEEVAEEKELVEVEKKTKNVMGGVLRMEAAGQEQSLCMCKSAVRVYRVPD